MNKRNLVFFLFLLTGIGLLNYPFVSQWFNQRNQSRVVYNYAQQVQDLSAESREEIRNAARAYNQELARNQQEITDGFSGLEIENEEYEQLLNPYGDGMMGYLEIPSIDVLLPIYHGTGTMALENGVGHLVQSSLPVGGADTHAILSAHTGLASKALFTDLDQLTQGDVFYLHILEQVLAYQVYEINIVLPYETEDLMVIPGEDVVTLVTCTPYGINSHRLLVTGQRISLTEQEQMQRQQETTKTGMGLWGYVVFLISVPALLISGIILLKPERKGGKWLRE